MPHYSYPLTASSGVMIALNQDTSTGALTAELEAPALQKNAHTLLQQLSKFTELSNGTQTYRFVQGANGAFQLTPPPSSDTHELTVRIRGVDYGKITIADNHLIMAHINHQLTAFEVRVMSQGRNGIYPLTDRTQDYTPRTDLHTHFAGALSGEDLINVGLMKENGPVLYPADLLSEAGIDTSAYSAQTENGRIALGDLSVSDREKLADAMSIPLDTQDTFNSMERIYALRGPISKDTELFKPLLWALGRDLQKNGVAYTEQSFSALINDPELMRVAHEELPKIQAETGVQIRFLAGLWRHSDNEWNQDEIDRIKALAKSPYIAGIDIMGHETNPTRDMADQIKELTKWAIDNDPNFTIRVHAGENPLFAADTVDAYSYNNVRETMTLVLEARQELAAARGVPAESLPLPQIRIGHGLYGADDETIRLFKETGATVEFNMTSNLSLNNLDHLGEVPLQKYYDAGIKLVLGTDGAGIYRTSPSQEAILAHYAGLNANGFEALRNTETQHIDTQTANARRKAADFEKLFEQAKQTGQDPWRTVFTPEYSTPDGQPRMNDEVSARKRLAKQEYLDGIRSAIAENGIITDPVEIAHVKAGKEPILLTGASKSSWPKITPENQQEVRIAMQLLADHINPAKAYILTGGTNFGVEKEMHEAAQRRNAASAEGDKLVVVGTLTTEAKPEEIQRNTVTHAEIVEMNGRPTARWFDLPDATLNMVSEDHGTMIAVGGGPVVRDMIQRGHNMGIDMLLMNGPEGASTEKSMQFEGKGYNVEGATALVARLYARHPDWFKADFDPAHLPQYRVQAEARIAGLEVPKPIVEHIVPVQEKTVKGGAIQALLAPQLEIVERDGRQYVRLDPSQIDFSDAQKAQKLANVYAVQATERTEITTRMPNGHLETSNIAQVGDWIVSNIDNVKPNSIPGYETMSPQELILARAQRAESYGLSPEQFHSSNSIQSPMGEGFVARASSEPRLAVSVPYDFVIKAPWGEDQFVKAGGVIINNGPTDIYGIAKSAFENTYGAPGASQPFSETHANQIAAGKPLVPVAKSFGAAPPGIEKGNIR